MRFGADMGHIICEEGAAKVIKTYSPDLIVYPLMKQRIHAKKEETADSIAREIYPLFERMHAIVIGPGLGREDLMQETAAKLIQEARRRDIPIVVDADGLWLIKNQPELVMGYENVVLTPNVMEFARLCDTMKVDQKGDPKTLCATLSKAMKGITIVQKGREDYISNGKETDIVNIRGGLKRCGGQGDVLSGCLATMLGWKKVYQERIWDHDNSLSGPELTLLAAYGACTVTRYCSRIAFDEKGRGMMVRSPFGLQKLHLTDSYFCRPLIWLRMSEKRTTTFLN